MGCLTAAAGQRCEQVEVPPQARGSQWKTRGIRKYKSDVSAVKFPAKSLVWASPQCLMHGCCSAGSLCWQQWTDCPSCLGACRAQLCTYMSSSKLAPSVPPPECHFFPAQLLTWFASLCLWFGGGDMCERWWDLAQVFCISSATDRTFI